MGLICKHSASFTCLFPTWLLKPFEFGSNLDKLEWQAEMHGDGSRGKRQTLCARWSKKPPGKKLSERKKLQFVINITKGQCHFTKRERMLCIAGNVLLKIPPQTCSQSWGWQEATIKAQMETKRCTRKDSLSLSLRTGHAGGRGRILGTSAWSPLEPAEMAEASINTQVSSGAEQCLRGW